MPYQTDIWVIYMYLLKHCSGKKGKRDVYFCLINDLGDKYNYFYGNFMVAHVHECGTIVCLSILLF